MLISDNKLVQVDKYNKEDSTCTLIDEIHEDNWEGAYNYPQLNVCGFDSTKNKVFRIDLFKLVNHFWLGNLRSS